MAELIPPLSMHREIHPFAESANERPRGVAEILRGGDWNGSGIAPDSQFKLRGNDASLNAVIAAAENFLLSSRSLDCTDPGETAARPGKPRTKSKNTTP